MEQIFGGAFRRAFLSLSPLFLGSSLISFRYDTFPYNNTVEETPSAAMLPAARRPQSAEMRGALLACKEKAGCPALQGSPITAPLVAP